MVRASSLCDPPRSGKATKHKLPIVCLSRSFSLRSLAFSAPMLPRDACRAPLRRAAAAAASSIGAPAPPRLLRLFWPLPLRPRPFRPRPDSRPPPLRPRAFRRPAPAWAAPRSLPRPLWSGTLHPAPAPDALRATAKTIMLSRISHVATIAPFSKPKLQHDRTSYT